jgi:hypothetical protein
MVHSCTKVALQLNNRYPLTEKDDVCELTDNNYCCRDRLDLLPAVG